VSYGRYAAGLWSGYGRLCPLKVTKLAQKMHTGIASLSHLQAT
jgi:hypothetical protein